MTLHLQSTRADAEAGEPDLRGAAASATPVATILLNITHGFQARMFLRSPIAQQLLQAGIKLVVCSPNATEEYFRTEFDHPLIELEPMPHQFSKFEQRTILLRQYVLMNPKLGDTLNHKREALKKQNPRRYRASRALNAVIGRIPLLRRSYMAAEAKMFPGREFDDLFARHRPNLIVTGTPGFNPYDIHILRAAKRNKIPSATVIMSWDNLTSKGYMNGVPDHLLVWSDLMREEAVTYHNFPEDRIHWCGAAQFDHYFGFRDHFDSDSWKREHGIPPDAGFIVYGTINPPICPHEPEIVKNIVDAMRAQRFQRPCYMWIRLHPQVVKGDYKHILQPYLDLAGDDVHVEVPPVQSEQLSWDLPPSDMNHLASLITAADMVITPCSTLSIDAACLDTPIINVLYDGAKEVDPAVSTRRFMFYTHNAKILTTGGIAVAENETQMVDAVNRYLDDRSHDHAGRQAILKQQFNVLDGQAGPRIAQTLMRLASNK